jgi:hypothetical protein
MESDHMNTSKTRFFHWPVLVIGVLLIVMPFAISLPSKASAGQKMLNAFHPLMQPAHIRTTVSYYNKTFVPLGAVAVGGVAAASETPQLIGALGKSLHMTPVQVEKFLGTTFPAYGQLLASFPKLVPVFKNVAPGLAFYKALVQTMQAQESNYKSVDSLPNFNLFTWFFVIPGVLLVLFGGLPLLLLGRRRQQRPAAAHTAKTEASQVDRANHAA